ncbi:hypothetical protein Bbelb_096080 [Branchiostoma belcheri]|nr:hypothetical protein Bbelb_096080 [Branchiostoma belcheri]
MGTRGYPANHPLISPEDRNSRQQDNRKSASAVRAWQIWRQPQAGLASTRLREAAGKLAETVAADKKKWKLDVPSGTGGTKVYVHQQHPCASSSDPWEAGTTDVTPDSDVKDYDRFRG